ncbi:MAG: oligosaccharide flippase family protein [Nitrospira sp.]|nr:oligosaccharide flippase family protein [Nitrospira sp.]
MKKDNLFASAALLVTGTSAAQLIAFIALPILSRIYSPADFGLFSVYAALLSIATVMACFRYEFAIFLPKTNRAAFHVFVLAGGTSFVSSSLFAIVIYIFRDWLTVKYDLSNAQYILWLLPPSLFFTGLIAAVTSWNTRNSSYPLLTVSKLAQSIPKTALQLLLGYAAWGSLGLVVGELLGKISGLFVQWRGESALTDASIRRVSMRRIMKMAAIYKRFPLISSWSSIINQLGVVAPAVFLAAHYGPDAAGFYAMTDRILAVPMDLIGRSVQSVYLGEASKNLRKSPERLRPLFFKFALRMFLLGLIPVLVIMFFGDWAFVALLGDDWRQAGEFAQVLCISFLFRFAFSPLSQTLSLIERQDLQLIWDVARLVAVCCAFYIVAISESPPLAALKSYTAVVVVSQISYALLVNKCLRRMHR